MTSMVMAVITEKKVAAPLPAFELSDTITNPLASAKLAMDQIKYQTADSVDRA